MDETVIRHRQGDSKPVASGTDQGRCGSCSQHELIEDLKKVNEALKRDAESAKVDSLTEGYDQALRDMHDVVGVTVEVTRVLGPAEGLTYLLERLREKDVDVWPPRDMPWDWLSRWKVELA